MSRYEETASDRVASAPKISVYINCTCKLYAYMLNEYTHMCIYTRFAQAPYGASEVARSKVSSSAADRPVISKESEAEATQAIQPKRAVASNAQPKELSQPI